MNQNQRNLRLCEVSDNYSVRKTETPKVRAPRETKLSNARKLLTSPIIGQEKARIPIRTQSVKPSLRSGAPTDAELTMKVRRTRRSSSKTRTGSDNDEREPWGSVLLNNVHRSNEKVSSFNNFDPLRTIHFLVKELQVKLRSPIADEEAIIQMAEDIQEALKRIPAELASLVKDLNFGQVKEKPLPDHVSTKDRLYHKGSTTISKSCQTPPTLSQDDTERFQKIMEDNTARLKASCRQLEVACTSLQAEKEIAEKDLEEARENIEYLSRRILELERGMDEKANFKIQQLEQSTTFLQKELENATNNNSKVLQMQKVIEELTHQKTLVAEESSKFQFENAILKLENEKYSTMVNVREREIKVIQQEMIKLQDQVNVQLNKLNANMITQDDSTVKETGDATITNRMAEIRNTINDNSGGDGGINNELPYAGDANEIEQSLDRNSQEILRRIAEIKASDTELNLDAFNNFDEFLRRLNSSGEEIAEKN